MDDHSRTRRDFLKKVGLGATLAGTGALEGAAADPGGGRRQPAGLPSGRRKSKPLYRVDVLVCGGGPAGVGAALAAARHGARTLLIENHAFLGGVASFSLGMNINQMRPGARPRSAVHELVIEKLRAYGDLAVHVRGHRLLCNVEYLKVALLDAMEEVGCKYLVHTRAADAIVEGGRITRVVVTTKQGLATIEARVVVDSTGDADVAYFGGAETLKEDGALSPMTLCLNVTGVDMLEASRADIGAAARKARSRYPLIPPGWGLKRFPLSNAFMINHRGTRVHGVLDATDPEELTLAESFSRRQALQMVAAMREFGGEALENIELSRTGTQIGVRETRRVRGAVVLTEEDAVSGRKFDDAIAWRSGAIDIGGGVYDRKMKIHDVPYRAILPEKLDGLLVAGRCISTTHVAASAGKSMGNCMATGHAAGLAAALAAKKGCMPRELDVGVLQDALRADGVDLNRGGEDQ